MVKFKLYIVVGAPVNATRKWMAERTASLIMVRLCQVADKKATVSCVRFCECEMEGGRKAALFFLCYGNKTSVLDICSSYSFFDKFQQLHVVF